MPLLRPVVTSDLQDPERVRKRNKSGPALPLAFTYCLLEPPFPPF